MRLRYVAATFAGAAVISTMAAAVYAQSLDVLQPASGAIVRETVPVRLAPGDVPAGGYVSVKVDGTFITARELPTNPHDAVYLWNTKGESANAVADGSHTLEIDVYNSQSDLVGTTTITVQVANMIAPPSQDLKMVYHWKTQPKLVYHRVTSMEDPGPPQSPESVAEGANAVPPPVVLSSSDALFQRTTENPTDTTCTLRDIVIGGTEVDRGQTETIKTAYNIAPLIREVNAAGAILNTENDADYEDHIGFPIPELPIRRVGKGDSWEVKAEIPLNWDGSNSANVTAECRLVDFEWQNNYPTAKIQETYSGPAHFETHGTSVSGQTSLPPFDVSSVNYVRTLYFAYGAGRLIKSVTQTALTLTDAQLVALGGTPHPAPQESSEGDGGGQYNGYNNGNGNGGYGGGGYNGGPPNNGGQDGNPNEQVPQYMGGQGGYPGQNGPATIPAVINVTDTTTLGTP